MKQEAGSRKQEAGSRKREAGSGKREAGSGEREAGRRKMEDGFCFLLLAPCSLLPAPCSILRPHKESGANSKRLTSAASVSANPNQVRVQRLTSAASVSASLNEVRVHMSKITKVSHPRGVCSTLNLWRVTAFTSTISWCRPGSICSPRQIVFTK